MLKSDGNGELHLKPSTMMTLVALIAAVAVAWGVLTANVAGASTALTNHIEKNEDDWQEQRQVNREILRRLPRESD